MIWKTCSKVTSLNYVHLLSHEEMKAIYRINYVNSLSKYLDNNSLSYILSGSYQMALEFKFKSHGASTSNNLSINLPLKRLSDAGRKIKRISISFFCLTVHRPSECVISEKQNTNFHMIHMSSSKLLDSF